MVLVQARKIKKTSTKIISTAPRLHVLDTHMRSSQDRDSCHYDLINYHLYDLLPSSCSYNYHKFASL